MGLYRILSGKICNGYLEVRTPKVADLLDADIYAEGEYDKAFADGLYTTEEMVALLIERNLLKTDYLEQQKALLRYLEKSKKDLYEGFFKPNRDICFRLVESISDELSQLLISYKQYEKYTCDGVRGEAHENFLLRRTTFLDSGEIYDWSKVSLDQLKVWVNGQKLGESEIRAIARSREWQSLWYTNNKLPFFLPEIGFSPEFRELLYWTSLYESVAESGEQPAPEIIDCDYAYDGFLIKQRDKAKASVSQRQVDVKGQEVFIAPSQNRSVEDIYNMNDDQSRKLTRQSKIMTGD